MHKIYDIFFGDLFNVLSVVAVCISTVLMGVAILIVFGALTIDSQTWKASVCQTRRQFEG